MDLEGDVESNEFLRMTNALSKKLIDYQNGNWKGESEGIYKELNDYFTMKVTFSEKAKWRLYTMMLHSRSICDLIGKCEEGRRLGIVNSLRLLGNVDMKEISAEVKEFMLRYKDVIDNQEMNKGNQEEKKQMFTNKPTIPQIDTHKENKAVIVPVVLKNESLVKKDDDDCEKEKKVLKDVCSDKKCKEIPGRNISTDNSSSFNNDKNVNANDDNTNELISIFNKLNETHYEDKNNNINKHKEKEVEFFFTDFHAISNRDYDNKGHDIPSSTLSAKKDKENNSEEIIASMKQFFKEDDDKEHNICFDTDIMNKLNELVIQGSHAISKQTQPIIKPYQPYQPSLIINNQVNVDTVITSKILNTNHNVNVNTKPNAKHNVNGNVNVNHNPNVNPSIPINKNQSKPKPYPRPIPNYQPALHKENKKVFDLFKEISQYPSILTYITTVNKSTNSPLFFILDGLSSQNLTKESKMTVISLYSYFFPFITENQKNMKFNQIQSLFTSNDNINLGPLKSNLLFKKDSSKLIELKDLLSDIIYSSKPEPFLILETVKRIKKDKKTMEDCLELYQIYLFKRHINYNDTDDNDNDNDTRSIDIAIKQIAFVLYILVINSHYYNNQHLLINNMMIMSQLFASYNQPLKESIELDGNDILFKGYNASFSHDIQLKGDDLFLPSDINDINKVLERIKHFFQFNNNTTAALIDSNHLPYVLGQIELYHHQKLFIGKDIRKYRSNLIHLEEELVNNWKEAFEINKTVMTIDTYKMPEGPKKVFNELKNLIMHKFAANSYEFPYVFELFPMGSITQLIGNSNSDIDIYLDVSRMTNHTRIEFLNKLLTYLKNELKINAKLVLSFRLCVISFTYKKMQFDLSCLGICPYLHSHLLRTYAIIDPRFTILAHNIKNLISIIDLKNKGSKGSNVYLNSFSWMLLLIVFLQDVIKPPILPKLLSKSPSVNFPIETRKKPMFNKNKHHPKPITFYDFFQKDEIDRSYIKVPQNLSYVNYEEIYHKMLEDSNDPNNNKKNDMSIAELFTKFLEWISFDFKSDTLFISNSIYGECIMNMKEIRNCGDASFKQYYNYKYHRNKAIGNLSKIDGDFLFREPFDGTYNPGQTLSNTETFLSRLRNAYYHLLQTGSFQGIFNESLVNVIE